MEWDHLRTFEAVARLESMTLAARALGVSQSTVSRHLSALERAAGSPLLLREAPLRLTERGESLVSAVLPMVDAALAADAALEARSEPIGEVSVTTVGEILRWILTGRLVDFYQAYPRLRLRILADNQLSSLATGEADVALRFVQPENGELRGTKVHSETYGLFASPSIALGCDVPWLGLAGSLAQIPEQRHADRIFSSRPPRLLVEDVESLGLAVNAGLGVAILPRGLATRLGGVVEVAAGDVGANELGDIPPRDLWMVVHRRKQNLPKVCAVMEWLKNQCWHATTGSYCCADPKPA